ncbi:hypothetical protein PENTCL1PPCAC_21395, partial [Pristionchus entomophagus]
QLFIFSVLFTFSMQSSTSTLIALSRLLSIIRAIHLQNNDGSFFTAACLFSLILPVAVSLPVFFSMFSSWDFYVFFLIKFQYEYVLFAYIFFWFSIAFAVLTFPFAFYAYFRIMRHDSFRYSYIYKLIVFNGIANCLQYWAYVTSNQIGVLPNLNGYFDFLMDHHLVNLNNFSSLVAGSVQWSTTMVIALNRLLSIVRADELRN